MAIFIVISFLCLKFTLRTEPVPLLWPHFFVLSLFPSSGLFFMKMGRKREEKGGEKEHQKEINHLTFHDVSFSPLVSLYQMRFIWVWYQRRIHRISCLSSQRQTRGWSSLSFFQRQNNNFLWFFLFLGHALNHSNEMRILFMHVVVAFFIFSPSVQTTCVSDMTDCFSFPLNVCLELYYPSFLFLPSYTTSFPFTHLFFFLCWFSFFLRPTASSFRSFGLWQVITHVSLDVFLSSSFYSLVFRVWNPLLFFGFSGIFLLSCSCQTRRCEKKRQRNSLT